MSTNRIIKIAGLNISIALINVILFSQGFIGLEISSSNVISTAFGITIILMSIVVFTYGNYKLISEKEQVIRASGIKTVDDYISALKQNYSKRVFNEDISILIEQIERLEKKIDTIKDVILQKFEKTEMSYIKFEGALVDISNVFFMNMKSILNKMIAFDQDDYERLRKGSRLKRMTKEAAETQMAIYDEYIQFIKNSVEDNEDIIVKLDKLLLEISKLSTLEDGEIENMAEMKEIDELITQIKLYK